MYKIAIINPYKKDGVVSTVLDGLLELQKKNFDVKFFLSSQYNDLNLDRYVIGENDFLRFSKNDADIIFLFWGKGLEDYKIAEKIKKWNKVIYIDGSEVGGNKRYDFDIQNKILLKKYKANGRINKKMLKLCKFYFRREKPYINGIIPLPFGIESRYLKSVKNNPKKNIDFCCVFGQDEYPIMRRYATRILKEFCKKNKFKFHIKKTKNSDEFYDVLSRSKVGVSIGGGGYDSYRFWEVLGNNCLLLTEKIDIFNPGSDELKYKRIWEFSNLYDFQYQLEKIGEFLKREYNQNDLIKEYEDILSKHTSIARVKKILKIAEENSVIK